MMTRLNERQREQRPRLICQVCQAVFAVPPSRATSAKFCSRACADKGIVRIAWNKGLTKDNHPGMATAAERMKQFYAENPGVRSGPKHWNYGQTASEELRAKMRAARALREVTPAMRAALELSPMRDAGRFTKDNHPGIARRALLLSERKRGVPNPAHAERLRHYYAIHPERHPNYKVAGRFRETGLERTMRVALKGMCIPFEIQFRVGRFWCDFAFPECRLAVEVDGAYWHNPASDRDRDNQLAAQGWRVLRFSEDAVNTDISGCLDLIATSLVAPRLPLSESVLTLHLRTDA